MAFLSKRRTLAQQGRGILQVGCNSSARQRPVGPIAASTGLAEVKAAAYKTTTVSNAPMDILHRVADATIAPAVTAPAPPGLRGDSNLLEFLGNLYEQSEDIFCSKFGYLISTREQNLIERTGGSSVYGEVEQEGVRSILKHITSSCGPGSCFMDLGSGIGRVVLQVATTSPFPRVVGIELSTSRHDQAKYVLDQLAQQLPAFMTSHVELVQDDVTTSPLLQEATHVFMCSTAFGAVACRQIIDKLARSPSFQVLVTSRPLPFQHHLIKVGEFNCQLSWNLAGRAYVYVKSYQDAPAALLAEFLSKDGVCWLPSLRTPQPFAIEEPLQGWKCTWMDLQPGLPGAAEH